MSKFLAAGRSLYECHKSIRFIFSTTALIIFLAAFAPGLAAQQSQLQNLNAGCGADYLGQTWNCTAGEIAISQVTGLQIQGNPTYCVIGEPLVILTANVEYSINTQARNDLTMYLGDQEGTDPRLFAGPGQSCSAFSVPGPFNPTPDQNNPWGNNDGDACGDLAFSVTAASRPFANVPINCQDNDDDGFADLQVLLTWDQNDKAICGQGPGQAFPTNGGTRSKCDFSLRNTDLPVVDPATLTIIKNTIGGDDTFNMSWGSSSNPVTNFPLDTSTGPLTAQATYPIFDGLNVGGQGDTDFAVAEVLTQAQIDGGWSFVSAECRDQTNAVVGTFSDGGGSLNFRAIVGMTIDPGDAITCTFTNAAPASLTVVKNTAGGNGSFGFGSDVPGLSPVFTLNTGVINTDQITASGIPISNPAGSQFTVTEAVPNGWNLVSATCSNGDSSANETLGITLLPGDDVTCTFTNALAGSLTIVKQTLGGNGSFDFGTDLPGGQFNITTVGNTGSQSYTNVAAGSYTVQELVPATDWQLTALSCVEDGDQDSTTDLNTATATINLQDGESVTCTFVNRQNGIVRIAKVTDPVSNTPFGFVSDIWGNLEQPIAAGTTFQSTNLVPGTYTVTESDPTPAGFDLTGLVCDDSNSTEDLPTRTATINLEPGETVTCTFTNTERGSITVVKHITATGPAVQDFDFTGTGPDAYDFGGGFTLSPTDEVTDDSQLFDDLVPGPYSVEEAVAGAIADGWELVGVTCTGETYPGVVNPATITLDPGEDVTCTFTNAPIGSATVIKNSQGGDGQFQFRWGTLGNPAIPEGATEFFGLTTSSGTVSQDFTFGLLIDNPYELTEVSIPSDVPPYSQTWNMTNVGCADPTNDSAVPGVNGGDATIVADSLETVTCTFTNTLDGTLVIRKQTVPDGDAQLFTFTGDAAGSIDDYDNSNAELFVTAAPDPNTPVTSTETVPAGWSLTGISCTGDTNSTVLIGGTAGFVDGDTTVSADLAAGETVICTFENTALGSITIVKDAVGADGQFAFNSAQLGAFSIDTAVDTDQDFPDLLPGSYLVSETVPSGWSLDNISCSGETSSTITIGGAGGFDPGDNSVTINLLDGEDIVCTFQNVLQAPAIDLVKTGTLNDDDGTPGVSAGDTISYAFTVTNTGNVLLTNITLADTVGGVTINGGPIASLAPAAVDTTTFTGSYTLTQVDIDAGTFTNTATATGNPPSGPPVTDPDSDTQALAPSAAIDLVKTGTLNDDDGTPGVSAGDSISYAFTVTNTGNVTLTNITLADTVGGVTINGGPIASLAPAAVDTTTFTGSYTLTQVDIDAGTFTNTATATGNPPSGPPVTDPDSDTQALAPSAAIDLVKTGTLNDDDGTPGVSAGDSISYAFTVTNTGNVTLTNVTLVDTVGGVTINGGPIASLAPAAVDSTTFTGSYTITQGDIDAGSFTNTATAGGDCPQSPACATDTDTDTQQLVPPRPPGEPQAIPVNNPWAILLLTLMVLAMGWYFRPPMRRNF